MGSPALKRHHSLSSQDTDRPKLKRAAIESSRTPDEQDALLTQAAALIEQSKNILVLAGAGISTSCGIPGLYSGYQVGHVWL